MVSVMLYPCIVFSVLPGSLVNYVIEHRENFKEKVPVWIWQLPDYSIFGAFVCFLVPN